VILKAGIASGQYVVVALLAVLVVIAFCAVMLHVNRMVFGVPAVPEREIRAVTVPLSCKVTLALAAIPLVIIGIYVPAPLYDLLKAAASAMGG
jgi:formate hydrogenlyase subunit 3/multisubunit Na+/H+ antiporter MnhD subunit